MTPKSTKDKNKTVYGFTSDDGSDAVEVNHNQRSTDTEQKRIDSLVPVVKMSQSIHRKEMK